MCSEGARKEEIDKEEAEKGGHKVQCWRVSMRSM